MDYLNDHLAQEQRKREAKREATKTRKAGKQDRIEAMLQEGLRTIQPQPMNLDFLGD